MKQRFFALSSLCLLFACGQQSATNTAISRDASAIKATTERSVSPSQLIIPGKSIGHTYINESTAAVEKRLGLADEGDAGMGKSMYTWYNRHDTAGFSTSIFSETKMGVDDTSRVKQIRITSPWFITAEGLGVNATQKDISAYYLLNKTASFTAHQKQVELYDTDKGIAFEIGVDDQLCSGIIVHEAGVPAGANYFPFHPNVQKK